MNLSVKSTRAGVGGALLLLKMGLGTLEITATNGIVNVTNSSKLANSLLFVQILVDGFSGISILIKFLLN